MAKLKQIDGEALKLLRSEINSALERVCTKYGLASLQAMNARYDYNGGFEFKLVGQLAGVLTREELAYDQTREHMTELPPRGSEFTFKNDLYFIKGWSRSRRSMPVIAERADGKRFFFAPSIFTSPAAKVR